MVDTDSLVNRLRKNARHLAKWARRQGISCYRVYDRDIPEFPLAIDRYGERVHLQEYDTGWQLSDAEHAQWVAAVRGACAEALELPAEAVHFKVRARQKGLAQYEKLQETGQGDFVVEEDGLKFWVNLDAYLDTGLFLDHRQTRRMVRERAAGKRFLNLFAYTGSFTVHAVAGGAVSSTTVDLSNTYQDWTRRNLALNGMDLAAHRLERADVLAWLPEAKAAGRRFDLIVCDPPTFSNSKKMQGVLDVQRDHVALVEGCMALLADGGELFFSNNLRTFQLDEAALPAFDLREISARTVPEDFRNRKIHRCWHITRKG